MDVARALSGVGLALRDELAAELLVSPRADQVDWLEVTPENWLCQGGWAKRMLDACIERWPVSPHCVSLSIAGPDPLDARWIEEVEALSERAGSPWWSDHLACSTFDGVVSGQLVSVPNTPAFLDHVVARVSELQRRASTPFAIENLNHYARKPGAIDALDEARFLSSVAKATGAGILLDVNTAFINATNHGFDAGAWLDAVPIAHVRQIHLSGHSFEDGLVIDDHTGPIPEGVWALYRRVIARAGTLIPTIVEWDRGVPHLDAVIDEVERARSEARLALAMAISDRGEPS